MIAHTEGVVTVTPSHQEAEIYLDGCRVYDTTILQHGALVRFGRHHTFRFLEPDVGHRPQQVRHCRHLYFRGETQCCEELRGVMFRTRRKKGGESGKLVIVSRHFFGSNVRDMMFCTRELPPLIVLTWYVCLCRMQNLANMVTRDGGYPPEYAERWVRFL